MEIILWLIIIALFLGSFAGLIIPFIPDTVLLWAGFIVYRFTMAQAGLPPSFWAGMVAITLLILGSDFLANYYFVKRYGGSKTSAIGAMAGLIIGIIVFGPAGIMLGPFILVFVIEYINHKDTNYAFRAGGATLVALFSSTVIKFLLQLGMIIWFLLVI